MLSLTPKQNELAEAIKSRQYRTILTGGAMSTAKSYGLCIMILSMAYQFPKTRYAICRKNRSNMARTIIATFDKVAEAMAIHTEWNGQAYCATLDNGSTIWFVELDETKDRDFNKIKGLELTAGGIDECNEVVEQAYLILLSRIGRENSNGEPAICLLTCNPSDGWVKDRFYTPSISNTIGSTELYIPSLPSDNPHNSKEYLDGLQSMPDAFRKRYVEGSWEYADEESTLFKSRHVDASFVDTYTKGTKYVAYDVARSGTDRSVLALWDNNTLVDIVVTKDKEEQIDLVTQAGLLQEYMTKNSVGYSNTAVDAVGIGAGLVDTLKERGVYVKEYMAGGASKGAYNNLRSEHYHKLAQDIENGTAKIYSGCPYINELKKDLYAHSYQTKDKHLVLDSKELIKKRIGLSPDVSDAVVMAYSMSNVVGYEVSDFLF